MKKALVIGLMAAIAAGSIGATTSINVVEAKSKLKIRFDNRDEKRDDARSVLRRTARVLERAQNMVREDDEWGRGNSRHGDRGRRHGDHGRRRHRHEDRDRFRYRGLGRAFAHQNRARDLYRDGRYELAIDHSLQARAIALRIIRRANDWDNDGWRDRDESFYSYDMDRGEMDDREYRYWSRRQSSRSDLELDVRGVDIGDDAVVDFRIEFDF